MALWSLQSLTTSEKRGRGNDLFSRKHTYGVVDAAEDIARRMGLDEEDVQLAKVIGLLHDIGRFEQIKRFDSFEPGTMEHAEIGRAHV